MKRTLKPYSILMLAIAMLLGLPGRAVAQNAAVQLYPGGDNPDGLAANQTTNTVFYDQTFAFFYSGGPICLSRDSGGCTSPAIDDAVRIYVDGTQVLTQESRTHDFAPVDFSPFLHTDATNQVRVQLIDLEGPSRGGSQLWLVPGAGGANLCGNATNLTPEETANAGTHQYTMLWSRTAGDCLCSNAALTSCDFGPSEYTMAFCRNKTMAFSNDPTLTLVNQGQNTYVGNESNPSEGLNQTVTLALDLSGFTEVRTDLGEMYGHSCTFELDHRLMAGNTGVGQVNSTQAPILVPPPALAVPASPSQEPTQAAPPLPPDGPRAAAGFWCFLPGFCARATAPDTTCHPQCVETANRLRPDLPIWGRVMTPDQILAVAQSNPIFKKPNLNEKFRVRVRTADETPQPGDLVVWPSRCDDAWVGGGHIGYVNGAYPFSVTDSNWDGLCGTRSHEPVNRLDCMRFITEPYSALQPDFNPPGGTAPSASSNGGVLDWLRKLFSGP